MKKQPKQLIILIAILAILAGAFWGVRQYNRTQGSRDAEQNKTPIISVDSEAIVKMSYDYEGETYTVEKEEDVWYDANDRSRKLIQYRIKSIAKDFAALSAAQVIENVTDMNQYGLAEGYRTISLETATESYIFYLGEQNDITQNYYICKPSEATVYAVGSTLVNKLNYPLDDMVEAEEESLEGESTEE